MTFNNKEKNYEGPPAASTPVARVRKARKTQLKMRARKKKKK